MSACARASAATVTASTAAPTGSPHSTTWSAWTRRRELEHAAGPSRDRRTDCRPSRGRSASRSNARAAPRNRAEHIVLVAAKDRRRRCAGASALDRVVVGRVGRRDDDRQTAGVEPRRRSAPAASAARAAPAPCRAAGVEPIPRLQNDGRAVPSRHLRNRRAPPTSRSRRRLPATKTDDLVAGHPQVVLEPADGRRRRAARAPDRRACAENPRRPRSSAECRPRSAG